MPPAEEQKINHLPLKNILAGGFSLGFSLLNNRYCIRNCDEAASAHIIHKLIKKMAKSIQYVHGRGNNGNLPLHYFVN
jgi:hypothetical protein